MAQKVASIALKLSQLEKMHSTLAELVRQCDKNLNSSCPIIEFGVRGFGFPLRKCRIQSLGVAAYRPFRFYRSRHFVVHDPDIDHIGNKRWDFVAIQQLRVRRYSDVRIPVARYLRIRRIRRPKSNNAAREFNVPGQNLRWIG